MNTLQTSGGGRNTSHISTSGEKSPLARDDGKDGIRMLVKLAQSANCVRYKRASKRVQSLWAIELPKKSVSDSWWIDLAIQGTYFYYPDAIVDLQLDIRVFRLAAHDD